MLRLLTSFAAAGAVLPAAEAILVAPDSPCSTNCGNVLDSTAPDDLVCTPGQYTGGYNNNAGTVFQGCVQCELNSGYVTKNNYSDNEAALYNLRYAVSYCVFNEPSHYDFVNNPCVTSKACGVFANAIAYQNLSVTYDDYGYCDTWPTGDSVDFHGCIECLQVSNNYLANFVTVLQAGCEQKPMDGLTLGLQGNIFSSDVVNITEPTPTAKVDPAWFDHGPLGLGGKVGVAVAGFILLLTLAGVFIVCRGRRRRKAFLRKLQTNMPPMKSNPGGWPSMSTNPHDSNETPISQRPLRNWDDSPMTGNTEKTFPRYFSPYSSQFNSPISANDVNHMPWPEPAHGSPQSPREIGLALGSAIDINNASHERWVSSPDDKGKMKEESYEMQYVDSAGSGIVANKQPIHVEAPILAHPGYGRNSDSPPRQYDVHGNAV